MWCLDCFVGLWPPAPNGATSCIVATCAMSKFVEAQPLAMLDSSATAQFLHSELVCRYGIPTAVRTDRG